MPIIEQKLNTWIIKTLLGTVEIKATPTEKWRSVWQKVTDFFETGVKQMAKEFDPNRDTGNKKKKEDKE